MQDTDPGLELAFWLDNHRCGLIARCLAGAITPLAYS